MGRPIIENRKTKYEYNWKSRLKTRYGLTPEDYNRMYLEQDGCCKICGIHQLDLKVALNVDHCHLTGTIRALLCNVCNIQLGVYEKRKEEFEKYLGGIY